MPEIMDTGARRPAVAALDVDVVRATVREALLAGDIDASAAMLTGSFARGEADPTSDVDVHVVHDGGWWQKRQFQLHGRTWETVVAPLQYYRAQADQGVLVLRLILYDAVVLWDNGGQAQRLIDEIRSRPKPRSSDPPRGLEVLPRHRPWALFLDLEAFRLAGDVGGFSYTAACLLDLAITHWTRRELGFLDVKQRYRAIREHFPELRRAAEAYAQETDLERRATSLRSVLDLAYASSGGISTTGETERVPWNVAARYMR